MMSCKRHSLRRNNSFEGVMEARQYFNEVVAEPLVESNQRDWFEWVENYLISQDLWEVVTSGSRPDENIPVANGDSGRWRRDNAAALHVIRISCGLHNLSLIRGISEAKVAWDILYATFNYKAPHSPPQVMGEGEELEMGVLYKAISKNDWSAAKAFIEGHPRVLNDIQFAALTGQTPLHVAAKFGHLGIVEELVRLVAPEYLEILNVESFTPLAMAATHNGIIPIAQCLVNKNSNALAIPIGGTKWLIPVTMAFRCRLSQMGRYLYSLTPLDVFKPQNGPVGPSFLGQCLVSGQLDIVLDLLQRCEELLFASDQDGFSTIGLIASNLPDSLKRNQLSLWKRWIYHYVKIPSSTTIDYVSLDIIQQEGKSNKAHEGLGLLHWLISGIYNFSGIEEMRNMKLQHAQAAEIQNLISENMIFLNEEKKHMVAQAFAVAAVTENVEFLLRVTKENPELISLLMASSLKSGLVFFNAVAYRQAEIFNLLRGFRFKNVVAAMITDGQYSLLHVAALLAPPSQLNRISGAALQMQIELQWFKAVENMVDPGIKVLLNKEGFKPLDFFKHNHKELREQGEKWMKETASSCSVVGALIVTIMFAAAFTVPGGNDQNSGYPMFLKKTLFKVFLISDALSLFSSTTSVLTFLGILTSRYAEEDFLYSLPKKLIIGLSTLFLSIATMLVAFSATIIIVTLQYSSSRLWAVLPVTLLAGVPITLFVLLQFPLLVEVISSTYGPGIFKKKVEMWPRTEL